jgi:hypothetical protein
VIYLGNESSPCGLIIAEALLWHVRDDLLTPQNTIDVSKLDAIARLSGNWYTRTRDLYELAPPTYQSPKTSEIASFAKKFDIGQQEFIKTKHCQYKQLASATI